MEFFFQTTANAIADYHLIVNVQGQRVLMYNDQVVKNSKITTATVSPTNDSGGYSQEIFIPWAALKLDGPPKTDSIWKAQVGREFHSWQQITCWGQVNESFRDKSKWGQFIIAGSKINEFKKPIAVHEELILDRCPAHSVIGDRFI